MFGNILGASASSRLSTVEMNFRRLSASEIALIVLRVIFVGVTVALFFAWLSSANTGSRGLSADADCVSFGRGGARGPDLRAERYEMRGLPRFPFRSALAR
jgi:hypothetical protein